MLQLIYTDLVVGTAENTSNKKTWKDSKHSYSVLIFGNEIMLLKTVLYIFIYLFIDWEECKPCPVLASYTLAFALQLRKKHGKTSVRVLCVCVCVCVYTYTGCNRRNVRDFGRVFRRSNYTDITQNTYIQS